MQTIETYFIQACPMCGRLTRLPLDYLGERATCKWCGASYRVCDERDRRDGRLHLAKDITGIPCIADI
jgi:uncharacterized protein (DUF983 family)